MRWRRAAARRFSRFIPARTDIVKFAYGYDGYYALLVIVIPAFVWGIPKIKKLEAAKKAE